ncbi:hypothetical protein QA601_18015 [Chitinispirillales bacterium ANBcel5]|uniref:leucine-rich repeat domain-containing protein n=1 Tax=Cellulosispirillum alkaliphilum TaxID=3039283 RepID=UPI002A51BDC4|nr:hypothetical protein [Chitinispirillales bacterium ANBcel5]
MRRLSLISVLPILVAIFFTRCNIHPTASGGSGTETTTGVMAKVIYPDGSPATDAVVRLRPQDYLPDTSSVLSKSSVTLRDLFTDNDGRFIIDSLDPGEYLIEVTNRSGSSVAFATSVSDEYFIDDLGVDTLRADALISGTVSTGSDVFRGGFIRIEGLERVAAISESGGYSITVPSGMAYTVHLSTADTVAQQRIDVPIHDRQVDLHFELSTPLHDTLLVRMFLDSMQLGETPVEAVFQIHGSPFVHKRLDLSNLEISSVHPFIGRLQFLTELHLSHNNISDLPDTLRSLPTLYHLFLNNNPLMELPLVVTECSELKYLRLDSTRITSLPVSSSQLSNLGYLSMSGTGLTQIPPVVFQMMHLSNLNLSDNDIETVPADIGSLARLTKLNFAHNKVLSLPEEISSLTELTYLYLYDNQLDSIPQGIGQCIKLRELRIDNNNLTHLPASIGALIQLEQLGFRSNQISTLPDEIVNLQPSAMLNVDYNELCTLPALITAWIDQYTVNVNWLDTQQPCP